MLTFEQLQRQGQGMQRSSAFWHNCWEVAESRLEFAASKAACRAVCQMLTSFTLYIHNIHAHMFAVIGQCSHLSCCRDQAKACSALDLRLPSGTTVGKCQKAD